MPTNYTSLGSPSKAGILINNTCKQARYGLSNFPIRFPMVCNTCTDRLCTAATVHFPMSKVIFYMLVTTKALLVRTAKAQVKVNRLL